MHHWKRLKLIAVFILGLNCVKAQVSLNSLGGNALGSGGSVSYSVGQLVYTTITGTDGFMAEGVQQPYEISIVTVIKESKDINLNVVVYPNPSNNYLILEVKDFEISRLLFQLYNMNGNLLKTATISDNIITIDMSNFLPGPYLLKVRDGIKEIRTFKVVKNQ
ncbi:MAG TPA: T9SS type A sorting domain-containing protein [Bacteroidales bacterium]|nr:T9SS type A sorting domain-containing protein [Bacteroidales bacterium]